MTEVRFVGYVQYQPTHWHAEFVVIGHGILPDHSQVSCDTLRGLSIIIPEHPSIWQWRRARFERRLLLIKQLRNLNLGGNRS